MSDLFQKIKKESMITSIICIVFGVMFCIWPGTILVTLCRIAGLVLLAAGIVLLVQGIRIREMLGLVRAYASGCRMRGHWYLDPCTSGCIRIIDPDSDRCDAGISRI